MRLSILSIRLYVKVQEQNEENSGVDYVEQQIAQRYIGRSVPDIREPNHSRKHLYYLHPSDVFLPPQVLLVFSSHRCQRVVAIHHEVYEAVKEREKVFRWHV